MHDQKKFRYIEELMNHILKYIFLLVATVFCTSLNANPVEQKIPSLEQAAEIVAHNPDSASLIARNALFRYKNNQAISGRAYSILAVAYDIKGMPDSALLFFHKAIQLQEKGTDTKALSYTYSNLGIFYFLQFDYPNALKYYNNSIKIDKANGDEKDLADNLVNLGIVYTYTDSIDNAIDSYEEAMRIYQKQGDSLGICNVINNRAKLKFQNEAYEEALQDYLFVNRYFQSHPKENSEALCTNLNTLAVTYLKLGQYQKSEKAASDALECAKQLGSLNRELYILETFYELYAAKGDFRQAFEFLKQHNQIKEQLFNEARDRSLQEMKIKFEAQLKDEKIAKLKAEKETETLLRKQNEIIADRETRNNTILLIVIGFLVVITIITLWGYRNKQLSASIDKQLKSAAEEHLRQKEILIGEIHHRVKNNLQLISSLLDLQSKTLSDQSAIDAIAESRNRVHSMSLLHQMLYQQSEITGIDIRSYINKIAIGLIQNANPGKKINFESDIDALVFSIDTGIPLGLIANELITNCIKHAFNEQQEGTIYIRIKQHNDVIKMEIRDNGGGFYSDQHKEGFGTKLVKSLCRQLKADWSTSNHQGTIHEILIKKFELA